MPIKPAWILYGAAGVVALLAVNAMLGGRLLASLAGSVAEVPVDLFVGAAEGLTGLPDTRTAESVSKCEAAMRAGDCWEASFVCPAGDYLACLRNKYY